MMSSIVAAGAAVPTPTPAPASVPDGNRLTEWINNPPDVPITAVLIAVFAVMVLIVAVKEFLWPAFQAPPGFATAWEIRKEMSARTARRLVPQTRPSLAGHLRSVPVREYAVPVGRSTSPRRRVYGTPEDTYLIVGPPRSSKSVWLNNLIVDAPGAVVHTSSKIEDHEQTAKWRALVGKVLLFNPERLGGLVSTLRWSPISGCEDPKVAISRAGHLLYGARSGSGDTPYEDYFRSAAATVLRAYLHAAALGGKTMIEVMQWVSNAEDTTALELLRDHHADQAWIKALAQQQELTEKTRDGVWGSLATALAWMADPAVVEAVTPGEGEQFDARELIRGRWTLYLVGDDREDSSTIAPLFTALTAYLVDTAKAMAAETPGRRLDPPLTLALDEVANICPIPLHKWISDCSGRGITVVAAIQSKSQLESRWGRYNASTIWNSSAFTLVTRGIKDDGDLESLSRICGERDTTNVSTSRGPNGPARTTSTQQVRVIPTEKIRKLPARRLLIIHRGTSPTIVRITPVWKRRDLRKRLRAAGAASAEPAAATRQPTSEAA